MVWAQIALLPVVIVMINVTNSGVMWRWNLLNWMMVGGYILGLLAFPVSRGLEKPKLLKWWLKIDFGFSLIAAILVLPLLYYVGRHYVEAEDGDYVLYYKSGFMAVAPSYRVGKKEGLFIRELPHYIRVYNYGNGNIDCFRVDTLRGCLYGPECGTSAAAWVLPIDSVRYHRYTDDIAALIDRLYQLQPLLSKESYGTFVFFDNFVEINYEGGEIMYEDSIYYCLDILGNDSYRVRCFNHKLFTQLSFPKDTLGNLSPKEVRTFIENLNEDKR